MNEGNQIVIIVGSLAILFASLTVGSKIGQAVERRFQTAGNAFVAPFWIQAACSIGSLVIGFGLVYFLL